MKRDNTSRKAGYLSNAITILIAIAAAFLVSLIFISAVGVSPWEAYGKMLAGIFKKSGIFETLAKATPYIIMALGVSVGLRGGQNNLGGDGQFYIGGLCSVLVGLYLPQNLPPILIWILALIAGALGGGIWGAIAGWMKARFNTSEVIITIMLNYCALYIMSWLVSGPLEAPGGIPQTKALSTAYSLPKLMQGVRTHWGIILVPVLAFGVYYVFKKTTMGYRIEAVGAAPDAAVYAGIHSKKYLILILFISGAFCGVAGMAEVYGSYYRVLEGITSSFGFTAMLIALLAQLSPLGIIFASLFISALAVGANSMQMAMNVPTSIVNVIQSLIIVFVLILPGVRRKLEQTLANRKGKEGAER